jgi:hypothetical protein
MSSEQHEESNNPIMNKKRRTASPVADVGGDGAAAGDGGGGSGATVAIMPSNRQEQVDSSDVCSFSSFPCMEDLLGLPVEILFRQIRTNKGGVKSGGGKPLMTRLEAGTFVKITLLAQELDILIQLTERVAKQQVQYKQLYDTIVVGVRRNNKVSCVNPWLTPLLPLMYSLLHPIPPSQAALTENIDTVDHKAATETVATAVAAEDEAEKEGDDDDSSSSSSNNKNAPVSSTMYDINASITQLVISLQDCSEQLMQASEQNWALVDSLMDIIDNNDGEDDDTTVMMNPTLILAKEKQALAELQEHVAQRIDAILMQQYDTDDIHPNNHSTTTKEMNNNSSSSCRVLFGRDHKASFQQDHTECSQQTATTESQKSARSFGGDDRILSRTTDLCTTLATVCQELFDGYTEQRRKKCRDHNANATTKPQGVATEAQANNDGGNNTKTRQTTADNHDDRVDSQSSTNLLGSPNGGANTQHAASVMLSLIHNERRENTTTMKTVDDVAASEKENGNNRLTLTDRTDDSTSTTSATPNKYGQLFDYSYGTQEDEKQQQENLSQFVRESAAEALTNLVNGDL